MSQPVVSRKTTNVTAIHMVAMVAAGAVLSASAHANGHFVIDTSRSYTKVTQIDSNPMVISTGGTVFSVNRPSLGKLLIVQGTNDQTDSELLSRYRGRLTDRQAELVSRLMGSLSLVASNTLDRFDYPST